MTAAQKRGLLRRLRTLSHKTFELWATMETAGPDMQARACALHRQIVTLHNDLYAAATEAPKGGGHD